MKILMINKFLYGKGGAETYMLKLGECLEALGQDVQYFGMDHECREVGNQARAYTRNMDFHNSSLLTRLTYPLSVLYSRQARKKLRQVLEDFQPDVCHLQNFNYQLTPSILLEIRKWEKAWGRSCRIVYTAHDSQLVCPNHLCRNPRTQLVCEKCLHGSFWNCAAGRCIHGAFLRSILGSLESILWHGAGVYRQIDVIICCSRFLKKLLDTNRILAEETVTIHNFVEDIPRIPVEKRDYVLYFGRYAPEKGIATMVRAARALPDIPFVFAGTGPLEPLLADVPNIRNMGFRTGEDLRKLIREASFSVVPSECYENCPFSILESFSLGTRVLGADIGGIPELIEPGKNGELFTSGSCEDLTAKIRAMWDSRRETAPMPERLHPEAVLELRAYGEKLIGLYAAE